MAECILMKAGSGTGSDECTATKGNVLAGKTAVTSDSDDEAVAGTMPNKGTWTSRIGVNGKAVIPAGYHNGTGYVDQACLLYTSDILKSGTSMEANRIFLMPMPGWMRTWNSHLDMAKM